MSTTGQVKTVRIGDALVERGLVTDAQVEEAFAVQQSEGRRRLLGEVLVDLGHCTSEQLVATLADAYGAPFVRLSGKFVDPEVVDLLPRDFIEQRSVLPLFRVEGMLTVAVTEPSDFFLVEEIAELTGCRVQIVAALKEDIERVLERINQEVGPNLDELFDAPGLDGSAQRDARSEVEAQESDSPVIQLVNHALDSAIVQGASDIHFEPDEDSFRVRFRVDGRLTEKIHPPAAMQAAIVARIKIMAGMDISERRLPQDGAIRVTSRGNPVDLRVSTLPNKFGEKVVIRVIDNRNKLTSFEALGLAADAQEALERLCEKPYGIILATGPTGSGKSTTLYTMLDKINDPVVNICTVEDPIEFNVKGVNQFQVHAKINLTFASVLRTLLRQDPDVIMVGEIRDPETASIATQAALTGHLVLSSLHTNDTAGAITRLHNLGVEPFLVSAALEGIIAQRLVRRVCPECLTHADPPAHVRHLAERAGIELDQVASGRGCANCSHTGYKGRTGIYELLVPDEKMREAIATGANLGRLRQLARESGMKTLLEYGLEKIRSDETTVEELLRVTCES